MDIIDDGINSPVGGRSGDDRGSKQALASPSNQTRFHCSSIARSTAQRMAEASAWIGEQTLTFGPAFNNITSMISSYSCQSCGGVQRCIRINFDSIPLNFDLTNIVFSGTTMQHFLSMVSLTVINNNVLCFRTN